MGSFVVLYGSLSTGQDLWDLIEGDDTEIRAYTPQNAESCRKWKIKCGKAFFTLRTLISKEHIDLVRDLKSLRKILLDCNF